MKSVIRFILALACQAPWAAMAQADFPNHAIRVIVPTPAGSSSDILGRIYASGLQQRWGQPVVIENRVGASHNIGADAVAKAGPDGYTLLTAPPPALAINQYLFPKLPFDPLAFVPVTVMTDVGNILVVRKGLNVKNTADLISLAKKQPGKLTYGSTGVGSTLQLSAEAFKRQADVDLLHVPFTGVPQVISEMLAGRVDVAIINMIDIYPYINDGSLTPLGVGTLTRSPELPDVPTIADILPGFVSTAWFAVAAPPKTPIAIATKLSQAIRDVFLEPKGREIFRNLHAEPLLDSPEEAAAFIKTDSLRWKDVIVANHIQAE